MKIKMLIPILLALIVLFPEKNAFAEIVGSPEPFDFKKGLLDDGNIIKKNDMNPLYYDNDIGTGIGLPENGVKPYEILFNHPVNIYGIYHYVQNWGPLTITVSYLNDKGEVKIDTYAGSENGYHKNFNYEKVLRINVGRTELDTNYAYWMGEIEFFGSYDDDVNAPEIEEPKPEEPKPVGDVVDLKVVLKHDRVDLSWNLPDDDNFKHVNIYRDTVTKNVLDKLIGVKSVKAETPIFETNGTFFNDLTVQPDTKYEYLLTTMSVDGVESVGVKKTVITLKKPDPEMGGGGYDKDPDSGDYTYYWTEPKVGKVKVMVGGKLYATVLGADQKIVIKAKDMKYTIFGNPDVQLIPVDDDGNEGKPIKPPPGGNGGGGNGGGGNGGNGGGSGNGNIPFNVMELMKITFDFIKMLGPFILVVLAIYLTPRLIKVIKQSMQKQGGG